MAKRPFYLRHARWLSLSNAFIVWLGCQDEVVRAGVAATKRQGRIVLAFPRCVRLSGWVRHNCLAVYALDKSGNDEPILQLDSLPIRVDGTMTFVCGFCEGNRREFDGREALWADHLFEPFADWLRSQHRSEGNEIVKKRTSAIPVARLATHDPGASLIR